MANKINLITGETYTLSELFSGERKIIIPDLQRDYCWGNTGYTTDGKNLIEGFLDTLLRQFQEHHHGKLNMGLLYGYEEPENFVQLCDGQQRITTLFLLLGMLNKWSKENLFRRYLMSDYEYYEDDHEPYLKYAIRETSLYFLSDLVYRFFAPDKNCDETLTSVCDIYNADSEKSCSWFYGEYQTDPSIMSMLSALKTIESFKSKIILDNPDHIIDFGEFLTDRLSFIYYDMGNRYNGEETFVVINTTGEPLSATENLKPLVINAEINKPLIDNKFKIGEKSDLTLPKAWEEIENWFWLNRDIEKFDTADSGFNEFLRWVNLLSKFSQDNSKGENGNPTTNIFKEILKGEKQYAFPYEDISINEIIETFSAFTFLYENYPAYIGNAGKGNSKPGQGETLSQAQCFIVLPLIEYIRKNNSSDPLNIKRLYEFLHNLSRIENVTKDINNVVGDAIKIASECVDILDILKMSNLSKTIITKEENCKLKLLKSANETNENTRRYMEISFWEAQSLLVDENKSLFGGEIWPLISWSITSNDGNLDNFSIDEFNRYSSLIKKHLTVGDNDKTRRALLAFKLPRFPREASYGWGENWKNIIAESSIEFKNFLDTSERKGIDNILKSYIRYANHRPNTAISDDDYRNYFTDIYIMEPSLLSYSDRKNIRHYNEWGPTLCKREWAKPIPTILAIILTKLKLSLKRGSQSYGNRWNVEWDGSNKLLLESCSNSNNRIESISISSTNNGKSLSFDILYKSHCRDSFEHKFSTISVNSFYFLWNILNDNVATAKIKSINLKHKGRKLARHNFNKRLKRRVI